MCVFAEIAAILVSKKLGWSSKQRCKGQIRLLWDMSPFISGVKAALFVSIIPKSLKTAILTNLEQYSIFAFQSHFWEQSCHR